MGLIDDIRMYTQYYKDLATYKTINRYYLDYLDHVLEHKKMVYTAWIYVCDTLCELGFINVNDMDAININMINHDNSKLLRDEFFPYGKRFNGPRGKDPRVKAKFKEAVKLHKERNLHHFEALKSYKGSDWRNYAVELVCDYIAMGWEFNNFVCEYFDAVKDELKENLPLEYFNFIESIINIIPERLPIAEEPLTEENYETIYLLFNFRYDPFEIDDYERKRKEEKN